MERYDLNGKVALVTGAARGIGFETARQMHLRGASVAVLDIDADEAREAAERIGPRAIGLGGDVTEQSALMNAVAEIVEELGGIDVAVANAGIAQKQFATVRGISGEEWERVFEVDMLGVWRTVRATLPQIVERRGQMIVVSSVYAFANGFGNTPYAVAKAGVESLGRALRVELKPHGASASVAYFGWVDTKLVQDAFAQETSPRVRELSPEWLLKRITPALRLGPARRRQPAARQADGERREDPGAGPRHRRGERRRGQVARRRLRPNCINFYFCWA
jgi:NAD(P)-dependent dehydrogenase (short-subunit alcohol dehydrogenase family)